MLTLIALDGMSCETALGCWSQEAFQSAAVARVLINSDAEPRVAPPAISGLCFAAAGAHHRNVIFDPYHAVCIWKESHMTSLAQTQQRIGPAEDSRGLAWPAEVSPVAQGAAAGRGRTRQALLAVDPSKEFGCVDWFLYPQPELAARARSASSAVSG
jgi:hypothetical protein